MSLLMQALKKAERARQNGLPEEDTAGAQDWGLAPQVDGSHDAPGAAPPEAGPASGAVRPVDPAASPAAAPHGAAGLGELSLEPLDAAQPAPTRVEPVPDTAAGPRAAAAGARTEPVPPLQPATEAPHDPVPPQARHEPGATRGHPGAASAAPTQARARSAGQARVEAARAGTAARARVATDKPGLDMARVRVAGLSGILLVMLATFGYVYWRATSAPGPGAALPMVPMPPPSATGATGIVVAPAEPASGQPATPSAPPDMPDTGQAPTAALQSATPGVATPGVATPGVATPAVAAPGVSASPARAGRAADGAPILSGPTVSDDPQIRQAAQQDLAERIQRAERERVAEAASPAVAAGVPPALTAMAPAAAPAVRIRTRPAAPTATAVATATAPVARTTQGDVRVERGNGVGVAPAVQAAYAAFMAGDYAGARQQYELALRQDPNNRDALLGSAAVAQRDNRAAQAAAAYARLLELDPADPDALAALASLRPGDTARSEAQLRAILRSRPDAGPVLFALGNLYAREGRWPEAQQAYFRAYTAAPDNADYAFNLAVGLDRLNQGRLAAGYYERALAATGPAGFDRAAVQRRLGQLSRPAQSTQSTQPAQPALPAAPGSTAATPAATPAAPPLPGN